MDPPEVFSERTCNPLGFFSLTVVPVARPNFHDDADLLVEPEVVRLPLFIRFVQAYLELAQKSGYQLVHFGHGDLFAEGK